MGRALEVLHIEDDRGDAILIQHELQKYWPCIHHHQVEKLTDLKCALEKDWDVILSDYRMPGFDGITALGLVRAKTNTPFIVVSGVVEEETAHSLIEMGANDCIMKDDLNKLAPIISRELKGGPGNEDTVLIRLEKKDTPETISIGKPEDIVNNEIVSATTIEVSNNEGRKAVLNILYAANLIKKHQAKLYEKLNLSEAQYDVLRILNRQYPKSVSLNVIKDEVTNKTSDISRMVEKMAAAGLLYSKINRRDRRARNISIAPKGLEALEAMEKLADEMYMPGMLINKEEAEEINNVLQLLINKMRI